MTSPQLAEQQVRVRASNIGGIDETDVTLTAGITVLAGRNATNRTSFLQAVMAGLGSDRASLKGDADEGSVELTVGDETHTRTLTRSNGAVVTSGDPYLDDPELADLFAFLLESNEARRTAARGGDLLDLIMRPVDTDAIQARIDDLVAEKDRLADRLAELDDLERDLPDLEQRRTRLENQIEEKRAALEAKEAEIDDVDVSLQQSRREEARLEDALEELRSLRSDLEDVRFNVDSRKDSLEALREERADLEAEREDLADTPMAEVDAIDDQLEELRSELESVNSLVGDLQSVIQFNEEMLDGTSSEIASVLREEDADGAVTDQLLGDDGVVCWTCGTEVERDQIEATLERLTEFRAEKFEERTAIRDRIDDLEDERADHEAAEQRRQRIERRLDRVERQIEEREARIEELTERREQLQSEIEECEERVEELETEEYSEILERHREANQLEFELQRLEDDLEETEAEIAAVEEELAEREGLKERREAVRDELAELRTQIERIEADTVEQFNEHMDTLLDVLEYDNIARIWMERVEGGGGGGRAGASGRRGRGSEGSQTLELHVVRSTESGATYEDTLDHLSESEREVTGLVFALAGYLVHEVHETVPFMLLDSLEAIDSERIAALVEYFGEFADHLVVALLPEDAQALAPEYERVSDI